MIVYEMKPLFRDRQDAGQKLAEKLTQYRGGNSLVLAIPHGGVPVTVTRTITFLLEGQWFMRVVEDFSIHFVCQAIV